MRSTRMVQSALIAVVVAAAGVPLAVSPASAEPLTVPYLCSRDVDGSPVILDYERGYDVTAPASVKPGEEFTVTFDNEPINPVPNFNTEVWDVAVSFELPANARYVEHTLTDGSNLGDSKQSVEVEGNRITLYATGPFKAGEDHDLPDLNVVLAAPEQGELVTAPAGTSAEDPGFRWTAQNPEDHEVFALPCYPEKPVELSETVVG